jgi:hypothetical protein
MIRLITRKLYKKKHHSTNEVCKIARKSLAMYLPTPVWIYLSKFSFCKHLNNPNRMYSLDIATEPTTSCENLYSGDIYMTNENRKTSTCGCTIHAWVKLVYSPTASTSLLGKIDSKNKAKQAELRQPAFQVHRFIGLQI